MKQKLKKSEDVPEIPIPVLLTEEAASKVLEAMKSENLKDSYLRVGVLGGGCSGLQYNLDFATEIGDMDWHYVQHGIELIVDPFSASLLQGTTIDWQDGLMQSGFKFINPNMKRSCGCGSSWAP